MFGRTNAGGGGISPFAFIFVTYPAGSICTCSNGSRTLRLKDTNGYGVFYPPSIGTWVVTSTDPLNSENTTSKTVEITFEGQSVSVELSYRFYLYNAGVYKEAFSYSDTLSHTDQADYIQISANKNTYGCRATTVNKVDTTGYSTLELSFVDKSPTVTEIYMGLRTTPDGEPVSQILNADTASGICRLDLSSYQGEFYIYFGMFSTSNCSAKIERIEVVE